MYILGVTVSKIYQTKIGILFYWNSFQICPGNCLIFPIFTNSVRNIPKTSPSRNSKTSTDYQYFLRKFTIILTEISLCFFEFKSDIISRSLFKFSLDPFYFSWKYCGNCEFLNKSSQKLSLGFALKWHWQFFRNFSKNLKTTPKNRSLYPVYKFCRINQGSLKNPKKFELVNWYFSNIVDLP